MFYLPFLNVFYNIGSEKSSYATFFPLFLNENLVELCSSIDDEQAKNDFETNVQVEEQVSPIYGDSTKVGYLNAFYLLHPTIGLVEPSTTTRRSTWILEIQIFEICRDGCGIDN